MPSALANLRRALAKLPRALANLPRALANLPRALVNLPRALANMPRAWQTVPRTTHARGNVCATRTGGPRQDWPRASVPLASLANGTGGPWQTLPRDAHALGKVCLSDLRQMAMPCFRGPAARRCLANQTALLDHTLTSKGHPSRGNNALPRTRRPLGDLWATRALG